MDFSNANDVSLNVDIDELGVRPMNWTDQGKHLELDDAAANDGYRFGTNAEFAVYSVGMSPFTHGKKVTTSDDDDEDGSPYEIDPETGEKIFHQTALTSNAPLFSPSNKWLEEYLSTIASFPEPTAVADGSEFSLEHFPSTFFNTTDEPSNSAFDSDWLSEIIHLDEANESLLLAESMIPTSFSDEHSREYPTTAPAFIPAHDESETRATGASFDGDYSTSSSSQDNHRSYRFHESDSDASIVEAKLEKIDHEEHALPHSIVHRINARISNQAELDEQRLRKYKIPIAVNDITQSSTDEYNHHLARLSHLSAEQIHVIKDIRRRGKNKIAAQNCRKRKASNVDTLVDEVDELKRMRSELEAKKKAYEQQIADTRHQFEYLHRQVLPGRPLPPIIVVK